MNKKVLVFNFAGNEAGADTRRPQLGGNRGPGWQQSIASLMEGLISLPNVNVFSTTPLNYGYKVPLKNSERKKHISSLNNIYYSYILDEDSYIAEC